MESPWQQHAGGDEDLSEVASPSIGCIVADQRGWQSQSLRHAWEGCCTWDE